MQVVEAQHQRARRREPLEQARAARGGRDSARPAARASRARRRTPAARRRAARDRRRPAAAGAARQRPRDAAPRRRPTARRARRARTPWRARRARGSRARSACADSSPSSRVLPIPGSPSSARNAAPPPARRSSARAIALSSRSRPTSRVARTVAERTPGPARGGFRVAPDDRPPGMRDRRVAFRSHLPRTHHHAHRFPPAAPALVSRPGPPPSRRRAARRLRRRAAAPRALGVAPPALVRRSSGRGRVMSARVLDALLPRLRHEPTAKRVRATLGGEVVLDSTRAVHVWEPRRIIPAYAVPEQDLRAELAPGAAPPPRPRGRTASRSRTACTSSTPPCRSPSTPPTARP